MERLTDREIKSFLNKEWGETKTRKLVDGEGLYLVIRKPNSPPTWRMDYKVANKSKTYTIGTYPDKSLADARTAKAQAKDLIKRGHDPVASRRLSVLNNQEAGENTFRKISSKWIQKKQKEWNDTHYKKSSRAIERDLYPRLGALPIASIDSYILAQVVSETIVKRGANESAERMMYHVGRIFSFAKGLGVYPHDNPVEGACEVALRKKAPAKNMPALIDFAPLGELLRNASGANMSRALYMLHRVLAFTAVRIGTARIAEWSEFDLESSIPIWTIPRSKLKISDRN